MNKSLIAPCGINCSLCHGYQREKKQCPGCNSNNSDKPEQCKKCSIINCEFRKEIVYCIYCEKFPCARLKSLEKRYRTKYGENIFENLTVIKEHGINELLNREEIKWKCVKCGKYFCAHSNTCLSCGEKNPYYIGTRK